MDLVYGIVWLAIVTYGGQPGCMFGACNYMVGSLVLCRSIRVYFGHEIICKAVWSMEVNPGVCLVHGIIW